MAHFLLSCHGSSSYFPLDASLFFQRIVTKFLLIPVSSVVLDRTQNWAWLGKWGATTEGCPANIQIILSVPYHTLCAGFVLLFFPLQPWLPLLLHLILTSFLFLFASVRFTFLSCPSPFLDLQCVSWALTFLEANNLSWKSSYWKMMQAISCVQRLLLPLIESPDK